MFCSSPLTDKTKLEHVLLNCLGGRKTTNRVICSSCNETLGSTIDAALCESIREIRNYLNFPKGDKTPAPTIGRDDPEHGRVTLIPGGAPVSKQVIFDITQEGDDLKLNLSVGTRDTFVRLIPHIAKRLRISEDQVWAMLRNADVQEKRSYLTRSLHNFDFGSACSQRSMAKMCLMLLGARIGVSRLHSFDVMNSVRYVVSGSSKSDVSIGFQSNELPISDELGHRRFGPFYNALIVRVTNDETAYGYFRLYNGLSWLFCLARSVTGCKGTYSLYNNPQNPSAWSEEDLGACAIGDEFFSTPDFSRAEDTSQAFVVRVVETYLQSARQTAFEEIVNNVLFDELGLEGDQPLSDGEINKIIERIAEETTLQLFRIPTSRPFRIND